MSNTGKASDQVERVSDHFDISNHTFVNQVVGGLQSRVGTAVPDMKLQPVGKKATRGGISLTLTGQILLDSPDDVERAKEKVQQFMDSLKNPANLLSLLDS